MDRPAGLVVVRRWPRGRRTPSGSGALRDRRARGELQHPAVPAHVVAERLEQPVAGRALRAPACRSTVRARGPGPLLHPAGERGADAAAAVVGVDGGVAAVAADDLGVRDQPVAVEDADGAGGDVVRRALPVADDVGLLDGDLADVVRAPGRPSPR